MKKESIVGGILGVVIGDAVGLPVQFLSRKEVQSNPVTGMLSGGVFNTPVGAWSDDSSLTLCLTQSLVKKGYDINDIADRFMKLVPGRVLRHATKVAIRNLFKGISPLEAARRKQIITLMDHSCVFYPR